MTRATMESTRSQGIAPKVNARAVSYQSPHAPWLVAAGKDMDWSPATAKARFHGSVNVFDAVERALIRMVEFGNHALAEKKLVRFEAVLCREVLPLPVALRDEIAADARQDVARGRYLLEGCMDSLSLIERETIREIVEKQQLLRAIAKAKRGHTEKGAGHP